jgi:hypothetical protein
MATEEQIDALCRRLQQSRREIFEQVHILKGDQPRDPDTFPRSHVMRALTGQTGRSALRGAAMAFAMARPKLVWRLSALAPLLRPLILRFVARRILRSGSSVPSVIK